jgi:uncharacterized protein YndB with AHSA1/START domain
MTQVPVVKAEMLIRKPVSEVFEAFVDPAVTSKFWFTKGSGRLAPDAEVRWDWEMYKVSAEVTVKEFEQDKRILMEWSSDGTATKVEWVFSDRADDTTFVSVTETGFTGDDDAVVAQAIGSTEGFTMVLAAAKALLEHGIVLTVVADRYPDGFGD